MSMMMTHQRIRQKMEEKKKEQEMLNNPRVLNAEQTPDIEKMTAAELKEYAKTNVINISGLTKKEDIKTRILETVNAAGNDPDDDPPADNKQGDPETANSEEGAGIDGIDGGTTKTGVF